MAGRGGCPAEKQIRVPADNICGGDPRVGDAVAPEILMIENPTLAVAVQGVTTKGGEKDRDLEPVAESIGSEQLGIDILHGILVFRHSIGCASVYDVVAGGVGIPVDVIVADGCDVNGDILTCTGYIGGGIGSNISLIVAEETVAAPSRSASLENPEMERRRIAYDSCLVGIYH